MKLIVFSIFALFIAAFVSAAPTVKEAPIEVVGTATTVSISTSAWTAVPTASTLARRVGIKVSNPSSNSANIVCILGDGTPSEATTVRPIEIQTGENPFIPVRVDAYLYCLSLHTSAESIHVQEAGQ